MKSLKPSLGLVLAAAMLSTAQAAESKATNTASASGLFADQVVAKGKNVEVKRSRLDEEVISIKATAAARGQSVPPEQMVMLERQILDRIINIQLLGSKATDADKAKAKETMEKRLDEIKKRAGSDEALARQLKSVGTTMEELQRKMLEELTAEAVIERELKVSVTDADVEKFYTNNPAKFEQPERVRAAHILLGTKDSSGSELTPDKKAEKKKLIEDLLKKARAGEDFAKLAKEHSEDPGSKDKGGEYTFPRGQMVPEFEAAAFSLKTNEVSDVVTTQFGYHIIKLYEKLPAQVVPMSEVASNVRDYLKSQAVQKELPEYLTKMRKEAGVEITDEKLKPRESLDLSAPSPPEPKPNQSEKK